MARTLDILLLLALPASGKSEIRRYLDSLAPAEAREVFGLGPTVQLDDFPYVHLMRRISDELTARGEPGAYFLSPALPFREPRDWGSLIALLNEDYADLVAQRRLQPLSAARWLMERFDAARTKVGAAPELSRLAPDLYNAVAAAIENECAELLAAKNAGIPDHLDDKTVVIEFARGGADASPLPLPAPYGYRYSLSRLSPEILARASILYVWVTPEQSRQKNRERTDPDDPGSILHHGVPNAVMYGDYGCDDLSWLLAQSDRPDTIRVERSDSVFYLPVARFDNRADLTTFIRADRSQWPPAAVTGLRNGLRDALAGLHDRSR